MFNKRKKKGFTLVELLAVIVILAVVILIAVTAVIPRMNSAKKNALVDEALMYLNAAKESYLFNDEIDSISSCINISDLNGKYINKSSNSYSGVVISDYTNGVFTQTINLTDGKFFVIGTNNITIDDVKNEEPTSFSSSCDDVPTVSASGTNISLDGTSASSFKSIELLGNSIQNGTPSVANPVDIEVVSGNKEIVITGKNLFDDNSLNPSAGGITCTSSNHEITCSGTATTSGWKSIKQFKLPVGTYKFQFTETEDNGVKFLRDFTDIGKSPTVTVTDENQVYRLAKNTAQGTSYNFEISNVQIEKGSTASSFEPYESQTYQISLGDISLRKAGDYADRIYYNSGKWYLDQNIRHLELKISEMNNAETYPGWHSDLTTPLKEDFPDQNVPLNNITSVINNFNVTIGINTNGGNRVVFLPPSIGLTQSEWIAQYSSTVFKFDYSVPSTITTEITDATLINQLNSLKNARCYNGVTNITSNSLPFNINASCYK